MQMAVKDFGREVGSALLQNCSGCLTVALCFEETIKALRRTNRIHEGSKDQEKRLETRILNLSACGFQIDSDDVIKDGFNAVASHAIKRNFTVKTKRQNFTSSKPNPTITPKRAEGLSLASTNTTLLKSFPYSDKLRRNLIKQTKKSELICSADDSGSQIIEK
jgi:hypothetical protein